MTIVGIDISLTSTGIACVIARDGKLTLADTQIIRTKPDNTQGVYKSHDKVRRSRDIAERLSDAICAYNPSVIAIELPSGGAQNASGAMAQGMCFMACGALQSRYPAIPWVLVQPAQSKKLAGSRNASKAEVAKVAYAALPDLEEEVEQYVKASQDDVTDAVAAILVALESDVCKAIAASEERVA